MQVEMPQALLQRSLAAQRPHPAGGATLHLRNGCAALGAWSRPNAPWA